MQINQLMTHHVEGISPTKTLLETAKLMKELNIGLLPVLDKSSQIIGVITDRDIVIRALARYLPLDTKVETVMTKPIYTIDEADDIGFALSLMAAKQVRRLPVVDKNNHLVGIISLADLAVHQLTDERAGLALTEISEPKTNPNRDLKVDDFPL